MSSSPFALRMRRELVGAIEKAVWPDGVRVATLPSRHAKQAAKAAHGVLEAGYWQGGGGAPTFSSWWRQLSRDCEFDPSLVFLASDRDGVVGIAHCWTCAFVKDLAVHPRARRRGIGRALMLTAFEAFRARGARQVDLKVGEDNVEAQALYRSLAMTVIARERI